VIEYDWWEKSPEWVIRVDGNLAPVLASLINAKEARTAFIALDSISLGVGDEWSKVLPAFRSCYDRIVGHFHLKEGGLRQWKQGLDESYPEKNGKSYFETFFCDAAAQCDAVILTSPALVACDLGLTPGAPIGCMVGQQIRRLGHALLDSTALDSITSAGETPSTRKPRLFALGSSSFYWPAGPQPAELQHNFDWSFARQGELVRNSFGVRGEDASPLVYTRFHDYPQEAAAIIRPLDGEWMHMYKLPEPTYDLPGSSWVRALELIALWPCEMDGQ
jgi:hypothetical protein